MKGKTTIRKDGSVVTEVLDREGQDCKNIQRITDRLGRTIAEDRTGPDTDTVHEIVK